MIQVAKATYDKKESPKKGMARLCSGNRTFIGKNLVCRKFVSKREHHPVVDPVWFLNEIVYYELASSVGLSMPEARILVIDDGGVFFGSELRSERQFVQRIDELHWLFSSDAKQLTLALILDLLLFNNDRTFGASGDILFEGQRLFFIDHGHSLWGDGRCFGDLHRVECERYSPENVKGYIKGFLRCSEANDLVWQERSWPLVQQTYGAVRQSIPNEFKRICRDLEAIRNEEGIQVWERQNRILLLPRLVEAMATALKEWAAEIDKYIREQDGWKDVQNCLKDPEGAPMTT